MQNKNILEARAASRRPYSSLMLHELAHGIDYVDQSYGYTQSNLWVEMFRRYPEERFPSLYAQGNHMEFWAESFTALMLGMPLHSELRSAVELRMNLLDLDIPRYRQIAWGGEPLGPFGDPTTGGDKCPE